MTRIPTLYPGEQIVMVKPALDLLAAKMISDFRIAPLLNSSARICISCGAVQSIDGTLPCDH